MRRSELLDTIFELQVSQSRFWKQMITEQLRSAGISFTQLGILAYLEDHQPAISKEIAHHFQMTASSITQTIDTLVEAGYLVREPSTSDRRVVFIRLSKRGQAKNEQLKDLRKKVIIDSNASLSDEELVTFIALQRKSLEQLQAYAKSHKA
jgi:DNA-binding MarR family transcriptional regulator